MVNYKCISLPIQHLHIGCKRLYNALSAKRKISTLPSLKRRVFCQICTVTRGEVLGVRVRLRKEAAIADGGLKPKDKTEGSSKLQRGLQAAGDNSTLMQRQGGNSFRARHRAAPWCPFGSRLERRGGLGAGEPWTSRRQRRSFPLSPGLRPRIRPELGFLPRNPRCSPASPARRGISTGRLQTGTATAA